MAIGIKVNKFAILYIVNKRHDITEHKNHGLHFCFVCILSLGMLPMLKLDTEYGFHGLFMK